LELKNKKEEIVVQPNIEAEFVAASAALNRAL
jgi:hypothetical protein